MEFLFECSIWYFRSERSVRLRYWVEDEKKKFCIYKQPCTRLYLWVYIDLNTTGLYVQEKSQGEWCVSSWLVKSTHVKKNIIVI